MPPSFIKIIITYLYLNGKRKEVILRLILKKQITPKWVDQAQILLMI
nr:MAG TPA: hypothetical protein [Caudoviricetes sp.]DAK59663.1 MAG TPA: hypothetical protein [Caudoviricetes sp.]DAY57296.1 MAG TPA: hypothetical protein [Caudoviricetes sp.]